MCFTNGPVSQMRSQMFYEKQYLIANQVTINQIIIEYYIDRIYRLMLSCECGAHFDYFLQFIRFGIIIIYIAYGYYCGISRTCIYIIREKYVLYL